MRRFAFFLREICSRCSPTAASTNVERVCSPIIWLFIEETNRNRRLCSRFAVRNSPGLSCARCRCCSYSDIGNDCPNGVLDRGAPQVAFHCGDRDAWCYGGPTGCSLQSSTQSCRSCRPRRHAACVDRSAARPSATASRVRTRAYDDILRTNESQYTPFSVWRHDRGS